MQKFGLDILRITAVKIILLGLFFSLGMVMMSSYTLKDFLNADLDSIEKTSESDENEKESESENENEEEDDKLEDFLRIRTTLSEEQNKTFHEDIFLYINSHSKHFGDTFTPPPDQV